MRDEKREATANAPERSACSTPRSGTSSPRSPVVRSGQSFGIALAARRRSACRSMRPAGSTMRAMTSIRCGPNFARCSISATTASRSSRRPADRRRLPAHRACLVRPRRQGGAGARLQWHDGVAGGARAVRRRSPASAGMDRGAGRSAGFRSVRCSRGGVSCSDRNRKICSPPPMRATCCATAACARIATSYRWTSR